MNHPSRTDTKALITQPEFRSRNGCSHRIVFYRSNVPRLPAVPFPSIYLLCCLFSHPCRFFSSILMLLAGISHPTYGFVLYSNFSYHFPDILPDSNRSTVYSSNRAAYSPRHSIRRLSFCDECYGPWTLSFLFYLDERSGSTLGACRRPSNQFTSFHAPLRDPVLSQPLGRCSTVTYGRLRRGDPPASHHSLKEHQE